MTAVDVHVDVPAWCEHPGGPVMFLSSGERSPKMEWKVRVVVHAACCCTVQGYRGMPESMVAVCVGVVPRRPGSTAC